MKRIIWLVSLCWFCAALAAGCAGMKRGAMTEPPSKYLAVWTGDEDGADPDFLTIIDADERSPSYGKVMNTVPVPAIPGAHLLAVTGFGKTPADFPSSRLNEPHHISERLNQDKQLFAGSLISGNIFRFDLKDPLHIPPPVLVVRYSAASKFSGTDDIHLLPNGRLLATFMGAGGASIPPALTTPGGLVEFSPDGKFLKEYDATLTGGPAHYRTGADTGPLANPHGIDLREDLNLIITSDYADPVSLATSTEKDQHQALRSTVRIWDLAERKLKKVVQVPDGPRKEKNVIHEEPEGLMSVGLLHGKNHKGAFTASMCGGTLYYSSDVTVANPVFTEVYDFGGCTGAGIFMITQDDRYLILPLSGIRAPGDEEGFDPNVNARRVVAFDIGPLLHPGPVVCNGDHLNAADCPRIASEVNLDSELNFKTHGGPHVVALDSDESRLAVVDYFVDLTQGFGLPGTGSGGDHRVYLIKRRGGQLELDRNFNDENDHLPGVNFNRTGWPHGQTGNAKPHGLIFVQ
jgi:hypothetical protein